MTTDKNNPNLQLTIYNRQFTQITEFAHLGHKLLSNNNGMVAVQHRIALGWAAFNKNKQVLTSKRVPYQLKSKIFDTYIMPVVLYGLDCVNWTTKSLQNLTVSQNHILDFVRLMTNKRPCDHIPINEPLNSTKLKSITSVIKSRVLKLYGPIKRSTHGVSKI